MPATLATLTICEPLNPLEGAMGLFTIASLTRRWKRVTFRFTRPFRILASKPYSSSWLRSGFNVGLPKAAGMRAGWSAYPTWGP